MESFSAHGEIQLDAEAARPFFEDPGPLSAENQIAPPRLMSPNPILQIMPADASCFLPLTGEQRAKQEEEAKQREAERALAESPWGVPF